MKLFKDIKPISLTMIYENDHFHPLEKNEIDDNSLNNKDTLNNIKKMDRGYNKISRNLNKVWVDGKFYKNINIEFYSSFENGYIRNAITGLRSNGKVGSREENCYFKVKMTSNITKKGSGILFYDSPEQFEKHQYCILSTNIKENWFKNQNTLKK